MVADDAASRSMWLGDEGALAGLATNALVIECSTLSYDWVEELAGEATARGLRYIDCPVTGLPEVAARGALTLLVGAETSDLASAEPYLAPLAERIIHFGGVGCGTAYKLMINLMGAVQIAAAAEGMAIAERAGLDLGTVADALALGQAASPQVVRNVSRMAENDHHNAVTFTPALRLKDAEYGVRLARKLGLSVPFGDAGCDAFRALCGLGHGDADESIVIEVARRNLL
jgi:3-hydroxyisobutyrate dehydrogenase